LLIVSKTKQHGATSLFIINENKVERRIRKETLLKCAKNRTNTASRFKDASNQAM